MHHIVPLPKEKYAGHEIEFVYESDLYYDVRIYDTSKGISVDFALMPFPRTQTKRFISKLYEPHWDAPEAYGIFDGDSLSAVLEFSPETWSQRLRVTNLWVRDGLRRTGFGAALMNHAKEAAARLACRAIVLETQTCNANAISFYLSQGFSLGGFDAYCYSNEDIEKKEVRFEMIYRPPRGDNQWLFLPALRLNPPPLRM